MHIYNYFYNQQEHSIGKMNKTRQNMLGETSINENQNFTNIGKQRYQFTFKLTHFIKNRLQTIEQYIQIDTLSSIIAIPLLAHLIKLQQELSLKLGITLEFQIKIYSEKLLSAFQKLIQKYEVPQVIRQLFQRITKQQYRPQQSHKLFKKLFYERSYSLYAQQPGFWGQLAQFAVLQLIDNQLSFCTCLDFKKQIEELQRHSVHQVQRKNHQEKIQFENRRALIEASISQVQRYQKRALQLLSSRQQTQSRNPINVAKFKNHLNIKIMMILETNFDVISLVNDCQAYEAPFLLFLVPFTYLLAETLSYYKQDSVQKLSSYYLFQELIKSINFKKTKKNRQLPEKQLMDHIVIFVNYFKYTPLELNKKMGQFISQHAVKMRTFIPVYYDIFYFHAFEKYEFIEGLQNIKEIKERRKQLLERLERLHNDCLKYNSSRI